MTLPGGQAPPNALPSETSRNHNEYIILYHENDFTGINIGEDCRPPALEGPLWGPLEGETYCLKRLLSWLQCTMQPSIAIGS